jgi:UDP-N-acetylmuramate: L-alanyl-gamma-D-glutamyl-meso-diaminopimelate ligase
MGSFLRTAKIQVMEGYAASNLPRDADLVVIGNAVSYGHPEVEVVEQNNLPYSCFPKILHELAIAGRRSIVVCGTHGKSTTTALTATLLDKLGQNPSYFIGGVTNDLPTSLKVGGSGFSVVEGDEYDSAFFAKVPKFVFYHPDICVINAIEFDHADIYPDLESINREFDSLVQNLPPRAALICCLDFENLKELTQRWKESARCKIITFGRDAGSDYRIIDRRQEGLWQSFRFVSKDTGEVEVRAPLIGEYNARNTLAALIACLTGGIELQPALDALATFQSVKRRQEVRLDKGGVVLVEDFAHHPTAVHQTVQALKEAFPGKKLWAVFEPRSNTSRRKVFQQDYIKAFTLADRAVIARVATRAVDAGLELLDTDALSAEITQGGTPSVCLADANAICEHLMQETSGNDVIAVMSNGSFGGLIDMLERAILARAESI